MSAFTAMAGALRDCPSIRDRRDLEHGWTAPHHNQEQARPTARRPARVRTERQASNVRLRDKAFVLLAEKGPMDARTMAALLGLNRSSRVSALLHRDFAAGRVLRHAGMYALVPQLDDVTRAHIAVAAKLLRRCGWTVLEPMPMTAAGRMDDPEICTHGKREVFQ